ncbi:MAG: hypothetical protein WCF93_02230 [Candidatus Moraniibacteriota bacterium]
MLVVRRSTHNPLLKPISDHSWESFGTFNWCPIQDKNKVHALYRAESEMEYVHKKELRISSIGYTQSEDGHHYEQRRQFIAPEYEWEKFGCEDPRVTKIEDTYYIFYTALSVFPFAAEGIKIAVATTKDFKKIIQKRLVTPFNAKAMVLFPEKINGKYVAMLSAHTDKPPVITALAEFDNLEEMWSPTYWEKWHSEIESHRIVLRRGESDHVEIGSAPIKTKDGWLLIYSHIQNYFSEHKIFGIEALLLDLKDPSKIVARTHGPLLVPEETYEEFGQVPNVIFPSGSFVAGKKLFIYYGATDTTCCRASVNLADLLASIKGQAVFSRSKKNPILLPIENHAWENKAVFNPAAVELKGSVHIVYRAMGSDDTSVMGYAVSKNGKDILERLEGPIYVPREGFEMKSHPGNSGCEDPRITHLEDRLFMFYTAYDGVNPPGVAATSIAVDDFLKRKWDWTKPAIITPLGIDNKDACLFPEKIKQHYLVFHRAHNHICLDPIKSANFELDKIESFTPIVGPRTGMWDSQKVGIAAPPIKTKEGWLLFYHGVSDTSTYRVGAILLALKDPAIVLARTTDPIFEPVTDYENIGQVSRVVFPCGVVNRGGKIFMYYGGGDSVVGVATASIEEILEAMDV